MLQSCRLARRSARKHTREMTKCGLIYLALLTVWCALAALSRALPALPRVLGLGYLFGAIGLGMNALLLRAVSPPEREIRLNKRAWTLLLILPLLYLPPLAGLCALLRFAEIIDFPFAATRHVIPARAVGSETRIIDKRSRSKFLEVVCIVI